MQELSMGQSALLHSLSTKVGVVPVRDDQLADLERLHELGYVATLDRYARITDEGRDALKNCQQSAGLTI